MKSTRMYALSAEHAQAYVQLRLSQKSKKHKKEVHCGLPFFLHSSGSSDESGLLLFFEFYRDASSCRALFFTIAFPCSSRKASAAGEKDSCLPYSERMLQTLLNSSGLQPD